MYFLFKVLVTALVVAAASEAAKRSATVGAIIVSLPLTSILTLLWLYHDTRNTVLVGNFAGSILWALLPTLSFFVLFPACLRWGLPFAAALVIAIGLMLLGYLAYYWWSGRPLV